MVLLLHTHIYGTCIYKFFHSLYYTNAFYSRCRRCQRKGHIFFSFQVAKCDYGLFVCVRVCICVYRHWAYAYICLGMCSFVCVLALKSPYLYFWWLLSLKKHCFFLFTSILKLSISCVGKVSQVRNIIVTNDNKKNRRPQHLVNNIVGSLKRKQKG